MQPFAFSPATLDRNQGKRNALGSVDGRIRPSHGATEDTTWHFRAIQDHSCMLYGHKEKNKSKSTWDLVIFSGTRAFTSGWKMWEVIAQRLFNQIPERVVRWWCFWHQMKTKFCIKRVVNYFGAYEGLGLGGASMSAFAYK